MKTSYLIPALLLFAACETTPEPKVQAALPAGDQPMTAAAADAGASAESTSQEGAKPDCDDKAKEKVTVSETEVKLGGGDTGCKLE